MLPKVNRLPTTEIVQLQRNHQAIVTSAFHLSYRRSQQTNSRLAIVVSKKVSPKATERNRSKRLTGTAVASGLRELPQAIDAILQVRINLAKTNLAQTEFLVAELFTKLK